MFETWYRKIRLTLRDLVSPEISNLILWVVRTLFMVIQSNYHLIHTSYLVYFQVCNMKKHHKKEFKILYLSLQNVVRGFSIQQSVFDFLKILGLRSASSLSSFSESNTWTLCLERFMLSITQPEMFYLA